jgi:type II secretory ATPase GspE/PulE/Tfp pilus assembly ATPase PilB-like protein
VPYAVDNDVLKVAVADRAISMRSTSSGSRRSFARHRVASRDDILAELQRLARTAEAIGSVVAVELDEEADTHDDGDDLEATTVSPKGLVRLVNAIIFQACQENASDVHSSPRRTRSSFGSEWTAFSAKCSVSRRRWLLA